MKKIDFNKPAKELAKDLLGKVICYNSKKYMITIAEAYPDDDSFSYIFRQTNRKKINKKSKSYIILANKDNVGKCFIYGGMLHFVCAGKVNKDGIYCCGNVLIRGAVRIDGKKLCKEDPKMEFGDGKPYTLCHNKLELTINPMDAFKPEDEGITFEKYSGKFECSQSTRFGLEATTKQEAKDSLKEYRFSVLENSVK